MFSIAFAVAAPLVDVLLGGGWDGVVPILRILIVGGLFQASGYAVYWAFLSLGLTGANLRYTLVARTGLIICIFVGSIFGVTGVATGYAVGLFLMWPFGLWWLSRVSEAPSLALLKNGLRIVMTYTPAAVAGFATTEFLVTSPGIVSLICGLAVCAATFVVTCALLPSARRDLRTLKETGALVRRRKK
jgi:PST family polysaccharide transporter